MSVSGKGGGGGVVRSRRQLFTVDAENGAGKIDVILGVNGFIWISKHVSMETASDAAVTRMEDSIGLNVYSSQNDYISPDTAREISRLRGVIGLLVDEGLRVDEDMVIRGYDFACAESLADEAEGTSVWLGGKKGRAVIQALTTI